MGHVQPTQFAYAVAPAAWRRISPGGSVVDEINLVGAVADKVGTIFLVVLAGYMLYKKKLVFGWTHDDCQSNLTICRSLADQRASKMEADLDRYRSERERGTSHVG